MTLLEALQSGDPKAIALVRFLDGEGPRGTLARIENADSGGIVLHVDFCEGAQGIPPFCWRLNIAAGSINQAVAARQSARFEQRQSPGDRQKEERAVKYLEAIEAGDLRMAKLLARLCDGEEVSGFEFRRLLKEEGFRSCLALQSTEHDTVRLVPLDDPSHDYWAHRCDLWEGGGNAEYIAFLENKFPEIVASPRYQAIKAATPPSE